METPNKLNPADELIMRLAGGRAILNAAAQARADRILGEQIAAYYRQNNLPLPDDNETARTPSIGEVNGQT